jgi:CRISPR system Cascade subunit CasC
MNAPTYVDVHILQTVPPSNLNRDDAGSPKQAIYGGVRRARVSSQAWKRATRMAFAAQTPAAEGATRTKRISTLVASRITARFGIDDQQAVRLSTFLLKPLKITAGKKESDTAYLLFFGRPQLDRIVDLVADRVHDLVALDDAGLEEALKGVDVQRELLTGHPDDVALFGRMVADLPMLNVDAATQVAHALSTHPVETEFDYFTAVDDENPAEETGAGMIGTVEFNSATLYRYATIGLHQLVENLGGEVDAAGDALQRFLDGFVRSMPGGHQNSFAHRTLPSLVAVVVRDDQPVNLVSAFEDPVRSQGGIAAKSAERLAEEHTQLVERWGGAPLMTAASYRPSATGNGGSTIAQAFGQSIPFPDLLSTVRTAAVDAVVGQAG